MSLSKKFELCINFLKSKGIISKTVKSYVLTNKQKEDLSYKSLEWTIKNKFSEDYDIVLECVKIIVKENKCEKDVLEKMLKIKKQDKIVKKGCLGIKCESDKICNPVTSPVFAVESTGNIFHKNSLVIATWFLFSGTASG